MESVHYDFISVSWVNICVTRKTLKRDLGKNLFGNKNIKHLLNSLF